MRNFTGIIKTTDGLSWSVGFLALSWEDAESIAEQMNITQVGECLGTLPAWHDGPPDMDNPDRYKMQPPVSHFCAWHFRDGVFVNEESDA